MWGDDRQGSRFPQENLNLTVPKRKPAKNAHVFGHHMPKKDAFSNLKWAGSIPAHHSHCMGLVPLDEINENHASSQRQRRHKMNKSEYPLKLCPCSWHKCSSSGNTRKSATVIKTTTSAVSSKPQQPPPNALDGR